MPTLGEQVQANIRAITGTSLQWTGDWHALFDAVTLPAPIPNGQWGERLLFYYNQKIASVPTNNVSVALNYFLLNPGSITL